MGLPSTYLHHIHLHPSKWPLTIALRKCRLIADHVYRFVGSRGSRPKAYDFHNSWYFILRSMLGWPTDHRLYIVYVGLQSIIRQLPALAYARCFRGSLIAFGNFNKMPTRTIYLTSHDITILLMKTSLELKIIKEIRTDLDLKASLIFLYFIKPTGIPIRPRA